MKKLPEKVNTVLFGGFIGAFMLGGAVCRTRYFLRWKTAR